MEMNIENLEKLWSYWIGKKMLIPGTLQVPKNFIGSIEHHKKKFLEAAKEFIENHDEQ